MYLVLSGYGYVSEELCLERCNKSLTNFIAIINTIIKFLLILMGFYLVSVKLLNDDTEVIVKTLMSLTRSSFKTQRCVCGKKN